jgi:hypothetical protein
VEHLRGFGDAMVGEPVGWRGILHCSLWSLTAICRLAGED